MSNATIKVSGPEAAESAQDLARVLSESGIEHSPPEVDKSLELAIALISLAFSGVQTAKTIWDWRQAHKSRPINVHIVFPDGTEIDLDAMDLDELTIKVTGTTGQQ